MKKPRNLRNMFSFSVLISFHPNFRRRDSTSLLLTPCLMSVSSHSSGTVNSSSLGPELLAQNCRRPRQLLIVAPCEVCGGRRPTFHLGAFFAGASSLAAAFSWAAALGSL